MTAKSSGTKRKSAAVFVTLFALNHDMPLQIGHRGILG